MLLLENSEVASLLDMPACLDVLKEAFDDYARGDASDRPYVGMAMPCEQPVGYYQQGDVAGATRRYGVHAIAVRSDVMYWPDGRSEDWYAVRPGTYCGLVMLFSTENGAPLAMLQSGYLQHLRVGGCAGIAAQHLAKKDARRVAILGSGGMARSHLEALALARAVEDVRVYSPAPDHREGFARDMSERLGLRVVPAGSVRQAMEGADIVAVCTDAVEWVVADAGWIEPGMHLSNLQRSELHPTVLARVDLGFSVGRPWERWTPRPPGSLRVVVATPEERARLPRVTIASHPEIEALRLSFPPLLDLLEGKVAGRTDDRQVTLFRNFGLNGLHMAALAGKAYRRARERGLGRELPDEWFIQDIND